MDLAGAYIEQVCESAPNADIAFDPFHVVTLANEAVSEIRRGEARKIESRPEATVLKGSRWAMLKAPRDLRENERTKLSEVARLNAPVHRTSAQGGTAHALCVREFRRGAGASGWLAWARRSRLPPFVRLARTLRGYRDGVLAAIRLGVSNGRLGGHQQQDFRPQPQGLFSKDRTDSGITPIQELPGLTMRSRHLAILSLGTLLLGTQAYATPCGGQAGETLFLRLEKCESLVVGTMDSGPIAGGQLPEFSFRKALWGDPSAAKHVKATTTWLQRRATAANGRPVVACLRRTNREWEIADLLDIEPDGTHGCDETTYLGWQKLFAEIPNITSAAQATSFSKRAIALASTQGELDQALISIPRWLGAARPIGEEMLDVLFDAVQKPRISCRSADGFLRYCHWKDKPVMDVLKLWWLRNLASEAEGAKCWSFMKLQHAYGSQEVKFAFSNCIPRDSLKSVIDHWTKAVCSDVKCH